VILTKEGFPRPRGAVRRQAGHRPRAKSARGLVEDGGGVEFPRSEVKRY
jgi:hypothetical protein